MNNMQEPCDIVKDRQLEEELRCPWAIRKPVTRGDKNYGSYDICEINGKSCIIEHGPVLECEIYNEWLEEEGK